VLAGSNATFLTGPDRVITVAAGLSATVLLTGAWSLVQRWPLKPTLAHPAAAAIVLVAVAVTVIQLVVTGDPNQTTLILLLVAGSGAALLSLRWLAATLYLTWGAWGAGAVLVGHSDHWPRHVVAMTLATGFAAIINALLRRMVRELAESRAAAEAGAVRDDLTGLSNRSGLALLGAQITEHARRSGDAVHCIFVDVVGLTTVNEKLGHDAGNDVLCSVAEGLRRVTRAADVVARWEGDKFCVLGPGPGMPPVELERRLRAILLSDPFIRAGVWIPWVSAGGSVLAPWDSGTLDTLLGKADHEMFLRRALRRESPPSTPWRASAE
jgi:diguanylate cyclase (GGDEF)-like protein